MNLSVLIGIGKINEDNRYIITEHDINITLNQEEKIKDYLCIERLRDAKPEEEIKDRYIPSNYTYEKCDVLEIIAYFDETLTIDDLIQFVKNNDLTHYKKIEISLNENMYSNIYDLSEVEELKNCSFKLPNNDDSITQQELKKTSIILDNITKETEDLSPLEKVMYLYDIVRDRVYEDNQENKLESRDLTKVLLGNKIVCLGYANFFDTLLKKVNISSKIDLLSKKNGTTGHARNIVYIDDPKYGIKALSLFDPTFDSKKQENDTLYLESYKHFFRPYDFFLREEYNDDTILFFNYRLDRLKREINKGMIIPTNKMARVMASFNILHDMIGSEFNLISILSQFSIGNLDSQKVIDLYLDFHDYLFYELKPEDFASCIINVRKKQQKISKTKYNLDEDILTEIIYNRYKNCENKDEEILMKIFGEEIFDKDKSRLIAKTALGKNSQISYQKKKV